MSEHQSESVIEALEETWSATARACGDLPSDAWERPTDCPGWSVRDHLSHMIGTERALLGEQAPPLPDPMPAYVHNPIGQMNEAWIEARRGKLGRDVLAEFVMVTTRRLAELRSLPPTRWDEVGPSPIGEVPYRQFMEIRLFDCWVHGQDIRWAIERPGDRFGRGEQMTLRRVAQGMPYVVGRKVAPAEGTTVVFEVKGPLATTLVVEMRGGRAMVLDETPSNPTVSLGLSSEHFIRLGCGRESYDDLELGEISVEGDQDLGRAVLAAMDFMI